MTQERLTVRKVREILRLKEEAGLSNRAIARACKISNSTVGEYLRRAAAAGLHWPLSATDNPLLSYFDPEAYFALDPDKRPAAKSSFNFGVFDHLHDLLTPGELLLLEKTNKNFTRETAALSRNILHRELERFTIELAWKSSKIEGNTYSLLKTETLI